MRKFSQLRAMLKEDSEAFAAGFQASAAPLGGDNSTDTPDVPVFDVAHPESLRRINAFLGAASDKPAIDPDWVLRQIKSKLSIVGLQFNVQPSHLGQQTRTSGRDTMGSNAGAQGGKQKAWTEEYDLKYLGGRYGVLDTSGKIGYDDNITHRVGHGLKLKVQYTTEENHRVKIKAEVIPSGTPTVPTSNQ